MRRSGKNHVNPKHTITQSEFHSSKKLVSNCVSQAFLEREKKHRNQSDVFAYHGCSNRMHPIQDFYKAVHSIKELNKPVSFEHPHKESFIFLRNHTNRIPGISLIDCPTNTENAPRNKSGQIIDDHDKKLRSQILACSYSLYDDEYGESALYFYNNNFSQVLKNNDTKIIDEQFSTLDSKHGISKIYEPLKPESGILLQIIIPEHLVEECVYVSRPYGFTYHINPDNNLDYFKHKELSILDFIDQVRTGKFRIDKWQGPPQLRVVLSHRHFANPKSGVKIYRHTTSTEATITEFVEARNKLYTKIAPALEKI
jgi:hypothetical protein